ncbi:MAG: hypothetical protein JW807_11300 [Spirochaetes bacterium]|nr:hypothetical protein [Spirochaetota bacterium]
MKKVALCSVFCCLAVFFPANMIAGPEDARKDTYEECEARCGALTGELKYRCLRTCINTRKRRAPVSESDAMSRFRECEKLCSGTKGLENVKCIRLCMDRKKESASNNE